jgi:AcrR family transcriptional regulator
MADPTEPPVAPEEDLTAYARIRNAALELFATKGPARSSIREIARHAGVSPGLVQHHFGTKANLQRAVNEFMITDASAVLADLPEDPDERSEVFGARMHAVARARPFGIRYMAQLVAERDETGLQMFDALVKQGVASLEQMREKGQLPDGLDLEWAAIHVVMFNLAAFLFEPAITNTLGEPLVTEEGIDRFIAAASQLLTAAIIRPGAS